MKRSSFFYNIDCSERSLARSRLLADISQDAAIDI